MKPEKVIETLDTRRRDEMTGDTANRAKKGFCKCVRDSFPAFNRLNDEEIVALSKSVTNVENETKRAQIIAEALGVDSTKFFGMKGVAEFAANYVGARPTASEDLIPFGSPSGRAADPAAGKA
jgi:hypothetical protein